MNKEELVALATDFVKTSTANTVDRSAAIKPELAGMRIFDDPLFGFADAKDPLFEGLREPQAVGSSFMPPCKWLENAVSVISFFLPFTDGIKSSNISGKTDISPEWLHARIEGQTFINLLSQQIMKMLSTEGFDSVSPSLDKRFKTYKNHEGLIFTSNWSERHAAYICGLGTFGLSKGLITERGIAGRFGSVITTAPLEAKGRDYTGIYDYCNKCGACVKRCPASAIDIETGKDHVKCSDFVDTTMEKYKPRYGCGKCQVGVPCQSGIPRKKYRL